MMAVGFQSERRAAPPPMLKLRYKILALGLLLVALTVTVTSTPVMLWAARDADQRLTQSLLAHGAVYDEVIQNRDRQILRITRLLAENPALADKLLERDEDAIEGLLRKVRQRAGAEVALILDLNGALLAQTDELGLSERALKDLVYGAAEEGVPFSSLTAKGQTFQTVTVALRTPVPTGWLTLGYGLDDSLAQTLSSLTGLQTVLLGLEPGAPHVLGSSGGELDLQALLAAMGQSERTAAGAVPYRSGGVEFHALKRPLMVGNETVLAVLQESVAATSESYAQLRFQMLAVSGLVLLLTLLGGNWIAGSISGPVRNLAAAARRIREGDYAEAVHVNSKDELHELAVAFNQMQEGIADREERITYQAQFDELTGLPNRRLALQLLAAALTEGEAEGLPVSLLVIDLNSLAEVASSLGHEIGDALLSQAAERLRASLDARHGLARLEGDEFLVIMSGADIEAAQETAEELLRLLNAGVVVRDVNLSLDARIGICAFPQHGSEPDKLLLRAAVAKNDAREAQESIHLYADGREERHVRQLAILGDLRRAVRQDELKLFLQPKINLGDGNVCGAEALVRWDHPSLGFLQPNEFIPVAEQSGNISLITNWALAAAVRECRLWQEEGLDLDISVNLSGRDLLNKDLPCFILEILRDHDLDARRLVLELTEQALVRDLGHASLVLGCVRDLGAKVAMDDFGTGYSSLVQIKNLPVDEVKIDRSFVQDLPGNRADVAIVRAAIELAHSLGMEVLAEGVENASAMRWLEAHGCERAQGFHISKPMPAEQFTGWVAAYTQANEERLAKGDPGRALLAMSRSRRRNKA
jgi:diguanylate cyclase (GGDEF)-like protein